LEIEQEDLKETDVLINLASAGVSPKKTTLEEAININILSASRLLKIGNIAGVKRFVYAGTCHEYGQTANHFEKIPPNAALNPLSFYGSTKASGFHLINNLSTELKLELVYARIFSAYGLGQNKYNFWPMLREAALSGNDFKMSSGKQVRDFIPAQLVAKHLLNASQRNDIIKGEPFLINIGTGNPISLRDFAKNEWKRLGAKGNLMIGALNDKKNEPMSFCPDISNLNFKEI
jgi:nucleoside-diphosphate-sugar epimerase